MWRIGNWQSVGKKVISVNFFFFPTRWKSLFRSFFCVFIRQTNLFVAFMRGKCEKIVPRKNVEFSMTAASSSKRGQQTTHRRRSRFPAYGWMDWMGKPPTENVYDACLEKKNRKNSASFRRFRSF